MLLSFCFAKCTFHEFHETCHSVTFYFMKKDSKWCCDTTTPELCVCFYLWCELTSTINVREWQVAWNSWDVVSINCYLGAFLETDILKTLRENLENVIKDTFPILDWMGFWDYLKLISVIKRQCEEQDLHSLYPLFPKYVQNYFIEKYENWLSR